MQRAFFRQPYKVKYFKLKITRGGKKTVKSSIFLKMSFSLSTFYFQIRVSCYDEEKWPEFDCGCNKLNVTSNGRVWAILFLIKQKNIFKSNY